MVYLVYMQCMALDLRKFQGKNNTQLYLKKSQSADVSMHWISLSSLFVSVILDYAQMFYEFYYLKWKYWK